MLLKLFAALIGAWFALLGIWLLWGKLLLPVRAGKNEHITVVIASRMEDARLEANVKALDWLRRNGTLSAEILVKDEGMDARTRQAAEILEHRGIIKLVS